MTFEEAMRIINQPAVVKDSGSSRWQDIATLDRSKMQFVLVSQQGTVRLHLWNPYRRSWERAEPIGSLVQDTDDCSNPTHWMPCPDGWVGRDDQR